MFVCSCRSRRSAAVPPLLVSVPLSGAVLTNLAGRMKDSSERRDPIFHLIAFRDNSV